MVQPPAIVQPVEEEVSKPTPIDLATLSNDDRKDRKKKKKKTLEEPWLIANTGLSGIFSFFGLDQLPEWMKTPREAGNMLRWETNYTQINERKMQSELLSSADHLYGHDSALAARINGIFARCEDKIQAATGSRSWGLDFGAPECDGREYLEKEDLDLDRKSVV